MISSFKIAFLGFLICSLATKKVQAQDLHFTQFNFQGLHLSPAQAGNFDGNFRISTLYRNQWATTPVPFNSLGLSFDMLAYSSKKFDSKLAFGLHTNFDQAGDGKFRSLYAQLPVSYTIFIPLSQKIKLKVSAGIYLGLLNKSFNLNSLRFDNQFNGEVFDSTIPANEDFGSLAYTSLDIGLGYLAAINFNDKVELGTSFGIHHINNIEEQFLSNSFSTQLKQRIAIPSYLKYQINQVWELRFDYLFQQQHVFNENTFGMLASYYFKNDGPAKKGIAFGSYYRWNDAVSGIIQYKQANFTAGLSYDINTSNLTPASNTYGAIEFGLVYIIKKVEELNIKKKRKCYVF